VGQATDRAGCPLCGDRSTSEFLARYSVPVHQNLLHETEESARSARRGALEMRVCPSCGFVFNRAFDPALLDYGARYDNSQNSSGTFSAYVDGLVDQLARRPGTRDGEVVEVGCGDGAFLRRLLTRPGVSATATGVDPAYVGPEQALGGRLRFERSLYGGGTVLRPDAVICRHVVEHVPDPLQLLRTAGSTAAGDRPVSVYVETPCVEWILRGRVVWDFFYEHCSLFAPGSLRVALESVGFGGVAVRRVFGDQYLWAEATTGEAMRGATDGAPDLVALVDAFDAQDAEARVRHRIEELASHGPLAIWGAGAKGATLCDLVDRDGTTLAGVVDVNPAKQDRFIGGTGHPILSPEGAVGRGIMTAVVLNPNYVGEVRALLARLGSTAEVCDLTAELQCA
jgi:SAM-dependent methyltransferase